MLALVTGANKGIGHELAAGLGAAGCMVGARDEQRREHAVRARSASVGALKITSDVTDDASATAAASLIDERFGRLDALVNDDGPTGDLFDDNGIVPFHRDRLANDVMEGDCRGGPRS